MKRFVSNINNPYTEKSNNIPHSDDQVFEDGRRFVCDSSTTKLKCLFRYYSSNITNKKMTFLL